MNMLVTAAAGAHVNAASPVSAQDWPSRAVAIMVPCAPRGIADITARVVAEVSQIWTGSHRRQPQERLRLRRCDSRGHGSARRASAQDRQR